MAVRQPAVSSQDVPPPPTIRIGDRILRPTPVFDTYWRFAVERQNIYFARLDGTRRPWTSDPVLVTHRFTNAYRAADRVSQFLIRDAIYAGAPSADDVVFRTLLFKFFNRIETWRSLNEELGEVTWASYDFRNVDQVLQRRRESGQRNYSAAYVIPPPRLGETAKHRNHLRLLELMMQQRLGERIADARRMVDGYELLHGFPSLGNFLAYQFTIDIGYSPIVGWSESEFVVPGPGARDGIRKCLGPEADGIEADVIRWMVDHQDQEFARLGLSFKSLWGRPLQLIDAQNLFCEVDKYARVVHPEIVGISGRHRIKQHYRHDPAPLRPWFPPKWGINADIATPAHGSVTRDPGYRQLTLV